MDTEFYNWFVARLKVANKGEMPPELLLQLRNDSHNAATQLATQLQDLGGYYVYETGRILTIYDSLAEEIIAKLKVDFATEIARLPPNIEDLS